MDIKTIDRVIVILADGARRDVLRDEIKAGNLPNISRHLLESGSDIDAVTSFPSTTGPAYLPFLTGCLPATCNVPGIRWFDKALYDGGKSFNRYRSYVGLESFMMSRDMMPRIKTIFELVSDSYSIFNPIARGAGKRNLTRIMRIWYWYYAHQTDRWGFVDSAARSKLLGCMDLNPSFVFVVFPAIDEYSHLTSPTNERVLKQYYNLDSYIGDLVKRLTDDGSWKNTAMFLVSDHGLSPTHEHFCVTEFLEEHRLPSFHYPKIFDKKGKLAADMVSGNSMSHVYFKSGNSWMPHMDYADVRAKFSWLLDDLLEKPAVDILAFRDGSGGVRILSRRGEAAVSLDGDVLAYEPLSGDPFGYDGLKGRYSSREWLKMTIGTDYPDAPFQVAHLLSSPRAGDMVISATSGYDLRRRYEDPEHFSSHGSLYKLHMNVPLMTNLKLSFGIARTADVFATTLKLLRRELPSYIDGIGML